MVEWSLSDVWPRGGVLITVDGSDYLVGASCLADTFQKDLYLVVCESSVGVLVTHAQSFPLRHTGFQWIVDLTTGANHSGVGPRELKGAVAVGIAADAVT